MKGLRTWSVPLIFCILCIPGLYLSGMNAEFVAGEVVTRFIRDGVMVLALIIPISAGMGLNFAIVVGAICAQIGLILAVDYQVSGMTGLLFIVGISVLLSLMAG